MSNTETRSKAFETTNRKLEQFLFVHDIRYINWRKGPDGFTVWTYELTPEVERVIKEYLEIVEARRKRRFDWSTQNDRQR